MRLFYGPDATLPQKLFLSGIEPGTFRDLDGCDNNYTTETCNVGTCYRFPNPQDKFLS